VEPDLRWTVEWTLPSGVLRVSEPNRGDVRAALGRLAAYYNEAHNRVMMAHTETMSPDDVQAHFDELWDDQDRPLLLYADGALVGDADLRGIDGAEAEFAIMVGERSIQGKGMGTSFAIMAHALAFRPLALERIYASILPENAASRRLFEKLGYAADDSPAARAIIDEETDLTLSLDRARFEELFAPQLGALRFSSRSFQV
jgi:RimJ/RimL family protein N-acetyltransferase